MPDAISSANEATTTPAAPPSRRRQETSLRLVRAARTCFATAGVAGSSVEEICEAAGFTRGAFYSNFADKDALVAAVLRHETEGVLAAISATELQRRRETETATTDHVSALVDDFVARASLDEEFYLLQTELALYGIRERHRTQVLDEAVADLEDNVRRSVKTALAQVDREPRIDVEDLVDVLTGVFHHGVRDAQLHGDPGYTRLRTLLAVTLQSLTRHTMHYPD